MDGNDTLLRRELSASLAREDAYRRRLWRHRELSERLRAHTTLLRDALRKRASGPEWLDTLIRSVATLSAQALNVPRTSVWLFDETRENLVCRQLVGCTDNYLPSPIPVATCPGYVQALVGSVTSALAVNDALKDPRTVELREYLSRHNIHALLDIPILAPGVFRGIVCHEAVGEAREWLEEEVNFATDVGAVVAMAIEAEQRQRAERFAEGSEAKYRHLVESLPVTVYSFETKTGQLDYISPRLKSVAGEAPETYLEQGLDRWLAMIEPEYRDAIERRLNAQPDAGFETELTYPIRLLDGTRRWIRDTCGFVRDARGRVIAAQGTLADVTALREAQIARSELERRYRALFEHADFLAVILDQEGRIQFINDAFLRVLGLRKEDAIGTDGFTLGIPHSESEKVRQQFLTGIRTGLLASRSETSIKTRGGPPRRILWTNTLIHTAEDRITGAASVGVDITDRLEYQNAELEREKLESLGRLAASVAHDFNNLLTVLSGGISALARGGASDSVSIVEDMNDAVLHATQLTTSLLTYAKRESVAPAALQPDELTRRVLPMLKAMAGSHVQLSCELNAPSAIVTIDPTQFRQVLLNLVGNAGEAVRGHGSAVRISSRLAVLDSSQVRAHGLVEQGGFYVITVADDGAGISEDLLDRIFDPFFTTKQNGTGLGLATSYSVVQRAGGFIDVHSVPLEGATFDVYLPAVESDGLLRTTLGRG